MNEMERIPLDIDAAKKRLTKTLMNNIGFVMGAFLIFAVIVIMTTDVHIASFTELTSLGLDFFLLLFCSYAMYVCCADSGTKAGLSTQLYNDTVAKFDTMKQTILASQMQTRMHEFCEHHIEDELKNAKLPILAVVGLSFEEYQAKYMHLDNESIDAMDGLTKSQKKAIKKANRIKPVKLTPEMILRKGRSAHRRSPLEINPVEKKNIQFGVKFVKLCVISVCLSMIALEVIIEPSWVIFASICLKLISIIFNGFEGYKTGCDNIVIDTVNYMNAQIDLMQQAILYVEANPIAERTEIPTETNEITTEISLVATND